MRHFLSTSLTLVLVFLSSVLLSQNVTSPADQFFEKGEQQLLSSKHDSSILNFERAKNLYFSQKNYPQYVASLNKLAENYSATFRLDAALENATKALEDANQYISPTSVEAAIATNNIGNIYYLRGQHEKALLEYEKVLTLSQSIPTEKKYLLTSPANLGIGNVFYNKLDFQKAFKYFQDALESNRAVLGDRHQYVANSYMNLGNLYRNRGSYNLAKENYDKALNIYESLFGENHPEVATTFVGMADIFKQSGEYEKAIQYYNRSEAIYRNFFTADNPKYGDIYLGLGEIYKNLGDYDRAMMYFQKALALYEKTIGMNHQNSVQALLGIANTYIYQEKFLEALSFYDQVLEINFALVGEKHENTSAAYNNFGSLYYFAGHFDLAYKYFEKALNIDLMIHGDKHPNVANAYYNMSRVCGERGETKKALELVQQAINSSILDFEDENIFVNPSLVNFFDSKDLLWFLAFKGELLVSGFSKSANMRGLDVSLQSFILSDSLVDEIRKSYTNPDDQAKLGKLARGIYDAAINGSISLLNLLTPENVKDISATATYESKRQEYQNWLFYFMEKSKGSILFSSLAASNAKSFGAIPDSTISKELALKTEINRLSKAISANPDPDQQAIYQEKLFGANRDYDKLVATMEANFPNYYDLKYDVSVVPLNRFQQFLSDSTAAVSYYVSEDEIVVNYIFKNDFKVFKVQQDAEYLKEISALRNTLIYRDKYDFEKFARSLYQQLFPEALPKEVSSIIVILDGLMSTIPFEVLLTEDSDQSLDFQTAPFLINDFSISYTFSANLLYKTFKNAKTLRPKAKNDGLALAPIKFDAPYLEILQKVKEESYENSGKPETLKKSASLTKTGIATLPGTAEEVATLNKIFTDKGKKATIFTNELATESVAKRNMYDYKYVHFATHGFVNQEEPEFSGIMLVPDATKNEDGLLFTGEIYNIALNSELVTMSACETGLGKISSGEGIIGLTRALIYAGTKNVNASLWKVSDASTMQLMTDFYREIVKTPEPTAIDASNDYAGPLRMAKLKMIKEGRYSDPYYWSPFVLLGK